MEASGIDDVPALRGSDAPLDSETAAPKSEGADFIIREALREDSRPLYVTVQGALTDVAAARAVFASKAGVWQIPMNVYGTVTVTMAELARKVRPCGTMGRYLYEEIEDYNLHSNGPHALRRGENWNLGDSPVVAALLRGNHHRLPRRDGRKAHRDVAWLWNHILHGAAYNNEYHAQHGLFFRVFP